jgi:predicted aldo/keto reductase-like oxidoreductase
MNLNILTHINVLTCFETQNILFNLSCLPIHYWRWGTTAGKAVTGIPRDKFVIATKWGPMQKDGKFVLDLSPAACRAACEGSLKRLGVEYIDLWILRGHGRDPNTPFEDTIREMKVWSFPESVLFSCL